MMRKSFGLTGVAGLLVAQVAMAQTFDNASVIALHKAGLGASTIEAKINSMPCSYDVSTDGLIALKRAGLGDAVISAMVRRCGSSVRAHGSDADAANPLVAHPPGIYLFPQGLPPAPLQLLRPSLASGVKVSGNGSLLFPHVAKLVVPRDAAQVSVANALPTFYFYFEPGDRKVGSFGTVSTAAAQSPDEFNLVRFQKKSGEREAVIAKNGPFDYQRGVDPRYAIHFSMAEVGDGIFRVSIDAPLEPGEYAFILAAETKRLNYYRIYDFAVAAPGSSAATGK